MLSRFNGRLCAMLLFELESLESAGVTFSLDTNDAICYYRISILPFIDT